MKIICLTCKEHVLNTTKHFKLGGPYDGKMFEMTRNNGYWGKMFHSTARSGNLFCPRCEQRFIKNNEILTEHGIVREGQKIIDTSFTVMAPKDHPLPGKLMRSEYSKIPPNTESGTLTGRERDAVVEQIGDDKEPDPTPPKKDSSKLKCKHCGKPYSTKGRGPEFHARHEESCEG